MDNYYKKDWTAQELRLAIKRLTRLRKAFAKHEFSDGVFLVPVNGKKVAFDIGIWSKMKPHWIGDAYTKDISDPAFCGTACCVAGTAGWIPEFRAAGLKSVGNSVVYKPPGKLGTRRAETAFERFFKLNGQEMWNVCMPSSYAYKATPAKVIRKLDKLIKNRKKMLKKSSASRV